MGIADRRELRRLEKGIESRVGRVRRLVVKAGRSSIRPQSCCAAGSGGGGASTMKVNKAFMMDEKRIFEKGQS